VPPQKPVEDPAGSAQGRPWQQSAFDVQVMPCCWHVDPTQTYGLVALVAGSVFATHGSPQQSAVDAHWVPAGGFAPEQSGLPATVHRGMPFRSTWQLGVVLSLPAQQSVFVLHDMAPPIVPRPGLQIAPAGLQTTVT
jgi:hypothetical protein